MSQPIVYLGDTRTLRLALTWEEAAFSPGETWNLIFTAKRKISDSDEDALFQKTSEAGITVDGAYALVTLITEDTTDLTEGPIHIGVKAVHPELSTPRTVHVSRITLRTPPTRETESSVPIVTTDPPSPAGATSAWAAATDAESLTGTDTALLKRGSAFFRATLTQIKDFATAGISLTWNAISGKPSTFPPTIGSGAGDAVAGNDARLADSREWTADTVEQAEAEAGTATTRRAWTAQRVRQAIAAWWSTVSNTKADATNAAINAEILKDAESTRSALSLGSVRSNQQITHKFLTALAGTAHPQFRIAVMGDSWRRQVAECFWYGKFGIGGRVCVPDDETAGFVTRAAGTTIVGDYASWCGFSWWDVPTSGTITKGSWWTGSASVQVSKAEVAYFAESGGGTFKIQFSTDGVSWTDVSGASYNTNNGGARTVVYQSIDIESAFAKNYHLRVIGVSGTSRVVAFGARLPAPASGSRPQGAVLWDMGEGGSTPANWVAMPQAGFTAALTGFDPDVVFIRGWDILADWQTHLPTLVTRIRAAKPLVDIIVVGRHPTADEPTLADTPQDAWVRSFCRSNNMTFVDVKPFLPTWAEGVSRLWYNNSDGVHLMPLGEQAVDFIVRDHIPLLVGAPHHEWKIIGNTPPPQYLHRVNGVIGTGAWNVVGPPETAMGSIGMLTPEGNQASNFQNLPGTGIVRLKSIAGWQHANRLGFSNGNTLTGIIGSGRLLVANCGTITGNVEGGVNKNINAGLVVQAPATNVAGAMIGGIASQTANILSINTGMTLTADGTTVAGFTATGRFFAVIPTYANDAAADADSALPSGGLYRITGSRTVFAK